MTFRPATFLPVIALAATVPASAASDFRLPESTPSPTPRAQGPVDPEVPVVRPTPMPSPTPRPSATPAVTPTPSPSITLPPVVRPTRAAPAPTSAGRAAPAPAPAPTEAPAAQPTSTGTIASPAFDPSAPAASPPTTVAPLPQDSDEDDSLPWGWIALAAALAALGAAAWHYRRRRQPRRGTVLIVPDIEKPRVPIPAPPAVPARDETPAQEPAMAEEPTHPLLIGITPIKLTQTFMNEALNYRLSLTNVGSEAVGPISVAADLVGAHAALPRDAQLAGPESELPHRHDLPGLAPGEKIELTGDIRTPLADLPVIRQGSATLLVPLARFRVDTTGHDVRFFTLAVGQQTPGASGITPIRLDLGPRSTDGLAGRAF